MNVLIADSGSTKTEWILTGAERENRVCYTEGYNPYFKSKEDIVHSIRNNLAVEIQEERIDQIWFYGAGCSVNNKINTVFEALKEVFSNTPQIEVSHDLLGAARSLLGDRVGFASILGTGTNTCLYDGKFITQNIDSLGYILGDEGSGAHIGKLLLMNYIRMYMPTELIHDFQIQYGETTEGILEKLYKGLLPNRYLASYSVFAGKHKEHPFIQNLIKSVFNLFFQQLVSQYNGYDKYTFNCTGSVGYSFSDLLTEVAMDYGMTVGIIQKSPSEGLINYHQSLI